MCICIAGGQEHGVHDTTTLLLVTLPNIHRFKKITHRLSNKLFLIWLLTTPWHLKCVATLSCYLSLMTCFADIIVSQGSVATHARCGGIFNIHLTTNLPRNLSVNFLNSVKIWQSYGYESVAYFFGPPCISHCRFGRHWTGDMLKVKHATCGDFLWQRRLVRWRL